MAEETSEKLVERSLFETLLEYYIYPFLYSPVSKLDDFLSDNKHLFTLMGVFGAVSIYLKTAENEFDGTAKFAGEFALVSGFALIVVLALLLLLKGIRELLSAEHILAYENWGLLVFNLFFLPLVLVIMGVISSFAEVWAFYFAMGAYFIVLSSILLLAFAFKLIDMMVSEWKHNVTLSLFFLFAVATGGFLTVEWMNVPYFGKTGVFVSGNATPQMWIVLALGGGIALLSLFSGVLFGILLILLALKGIYTGGKLMIDNIRG